MILSKRSKKTLGALFIAAVISGIWFINPASAGRNTDSNGWKAIMSFGQAMRDIQERALQYWFVYAGLLLLMIAFVVYSYFYQKKLDADKTIFRITHEGSSGKRTFLRLAVEQEFFYARALDKTYRKAKVVDLGGGGLLFEASERLRLGEELKIVMELYPDVVIRLRAKVIRANAKKDAIARESFMIGLEFSEIGSSDQDRIIKRILKEQQEVVVEERRKKQNQCIFCGDPLPQETIGVRLYCSNCVVYQSEEKEKPQQTSI